MADPSRSRETWTTESVVQVCQTFGVAHTNPPSLGQLRQFVAACDGLPDNTAVSIDMGSLDEGGRRSCTLRLTIKEQHASPLPGHPKTEEGENDG